MASPQARTGRRKSVDPSMMSPRDSTFGGKEALPISEEANVQVVCRLRPFNQREIELHEESNTGKQEWDRFPLRSCIEFNNTTCAYLDPEKGFAVKEQFGFDGCLWSIPDEVQKCDTNPFATQATVFEQFGGQLLQQAWKGFNTCFFAYGQTGSGKTHSMMGKFDVATGLNAPDADPGLIPRLCQELFKQIEAARAEAQANEDKQVKAFRVEVRYMEIYNEQVKDLLWSRSQLAPEIKVKANPDNLKIRSSPATGVFVEHLTPVEVESWEEMVELIEVGNSSRHTAATKMNERSSRSHAVFKVTLSQITTIIPKKQFEKPTEHIRDAFINLVDLAGSERNKKTGATGERLKEAASINKSLSCLKSVIDALVDNSTTKGPKKRIPYRDSHLTSILMDSLGGNSKTCMLVCLSPHSDNAEETLQTLKYGSKARQIVSTVTVNENASARMMLDLEEELTRMKNELEKAQSESSKTEAVENLRSQIDEHESTIKHLESEMTTQQAMLEELREKKEKEMNRRHAAAFANLHALTQARLKKDEAEVAHSKVVKELTGLEEEKASLETRQEKAEKDIDRLRDQTEDHKQRSAEVEHSIEQWRKRASKLEHYCRDLSKTVEEEENELKAVRDSKIATILRARLQAARIRIDFRRRSEQQKQKTEEELRLLTQSADETIAKEKAEFDAQEAELQSEVDRLQNTLNTIQSDTKRMNTDKDGQIAKLEEEVSLLKKENRRKTEENQVRIQQAALDWDRKHEAMIEDMKTQYAAAEREWSEKYARDAESEETAYKEHQGSWAAEVEGVRKEWRDKISKANADGEAKCSAADRAAKQQFDEKQSINDALRTELRGILERETLYSDMLHRVSNVLESSPKPGMRHSKEYRTLHDTMRSFQAEYEDNMPSKFTIEQLLHADFTRSRCNTAPTVHGGRSVSPARVQASKLTSVKPAPKVSATPKKK